MVHGVLNEQEAQHSAADVWDFLERHYDDIRRDQPETWDQWTRLKSLGILGDLPVLSPQFFRNRENPAAHQAFAALFGTDDLLVSVDRASLMRPTVGVVMSDGKVEDKPEWRTKAECQ